MYRMLRNKAQSLAEPVGRFAQELIRVPSPSFQESGVADRVESTMKKLGYDRVLRDDHGNVVGVILGRDGGPTLLLNCHMDTMPASGPEEAWGSSPTDGRIENGRLHGLGASDCKSGLAVHVYTGALLRQSLLPLRGNLVVAATVAEETGHSQGVRALMEETLPSLELKPDAALLGEPTDLSLYYGHDGWLEFDIQVEGANPFHVDDAARTIFDDLEARRSSAGADSRPEALVVYQPRFEDEDGRRRSTIRTARRLGDGDGVEQVLDQVRHDVRLMAREAGEVSVAVMVAEENRQLYTGRTCLVRHVTHAWAIDPFHPLMERSRGALMAADAPAKAGKWKLGRLGMGTAGGVLVRDYDVPAIGYGPGCESQAHAPGESIELAKLGPALYGTAAIVHSQIGVPVYGWTSDDI